MRKFLFLSIAFICAMQIFAQKMSGEKFNVLTKEFETPHLQWAEPLKGGELKALFIISLHNARHVVELAQRMDVSLDAITLGLRDNDWFFGITADDDRNYGEVYTGTGEMEKNQELLQKLDLPFETVLVEHVDFNKVSNEGKFKLFSKVKGGTGLVLANCRNIPAGLIKDTIPNNVMDGVGETRIDGGTYDTYQGDLKLKKTETPKSYIFGKGKVLVYQSPGVVHAPFAYQSPRWWMLYENAHVKLMRSLLWTAGRLPEKTASVRCEGDTLKISGIGGEVQLRLRNEYNKVLKDGKIRMDGETGWKIPALPAGEYYCDVIAAENGKAADVSYSTFVKERKADLEFIVENDSVNGFDALKGVIRTDRPLKNGSMKITLSDSPNERIWYQSTAKFADGTREIPVSVSDYYMPNLAAFMKVELFEDGVPLAVVDKTFFFPEYLTGKMPPYHDSQWEYNPLGIDRLRAMAESEVMGFGSMHSRFDGSRPDTRQYFLQNVRPGGSLLRLDVRQKNPENALVTGAFWGDLSGNLPNLKKAGLLKETDLPLLKNPRLTPAEEPGKRLAWLYTEEYFRNKSLEKYPLYFYGIGNEVGSDYHFGFSKEDNAAYAEFLKKRYGTIANLNREWKRAYQDFAEVPHLQMEEAIQKKLYPECFAHVNYVNKTVELFGAQLANEMKMRAIHSKIGCDGVWSNNNDGFNMEDIFLHPEINTWAPYTRLPQIEMIRSMRPDMKPFCVWGWILGDNALPGEPWFNLLITPLSEATWFVSGPYVLGAKTTADYRPWRKRFQMEMQCLREGPAQFLNLTPLVSDGIAIWENYASTRAALLGDARFKPPTDSSLDLIALTYKLGVNFDYVVKATLPRLRQEKVLFLCSATAVGEDVAAELGKYVEDGGIVVADLNPGMMNESFGMGDKSTLSSLFGDFDPQKVETPKHAPLKINTVFNGQKLVLNSEAMQTPGFMPFSVKKTGKGYAVLLNFTLSTAKMNCKDGSYDSFMRDLLAACGVKPALKTTGLPADSVTRIRKGNGFELIGFTNRKMAENGVDGGEVTVTLPQEGYVYEVGKGAIGKNQEFKFQFAPVFKLFTVFRQEQKAPLFKLSEEVAKPGIPLQLDLTPFQKDRVYLLQIRNQKGELIRFRNEAVTHEVICADGKTKSFPICFSYSDNKGQYTLTLTDIATGLKSVKTISLK